jgi:hypothetical protein
MSAIHEPISVAVATHKQSDCMPPLDFPNIEVPDDKGLSDYFRDVTETRLANMPFGESNGCWPDTENMRSVLKKESRDLTSLGFLTYFLVAADIATHVPQDIAVLQGRIDWSGSLTAHVLGIAGRSPIFPSFRANGRFALPLLTLGYSGAMHQALVDYCAAKYGQGHIGFSMDGEVEGRISGLLLTQSNLRESELVTELRYDIPCIMGNELSLLLDHRLVVMRLAHGTEAVQS